MAEKSCFLRGSLFFSPVAASRGQAQGGRGVIARLRNLQPRLEPLLRSGRVSKSMKLDMNSTAYGFFYVRENAPNEIHDARCAWSCLTNQLAIAMHLVIVQALFGAAATRMSFVPQRDSPALPICQASSYSAILEDQSKPWVPQHSHRRGQFFGLGVLLVVVATWGLASDPVGNESHWIAKAITRPPVTTANPKAVQYPGFKRALTGARQVEVAHASPVHHGSNPNVRRRESFLDTFLGPNPLPPSWASFALGTALVALTATIAFFVRGRRRVSMAMVLGKETDDDDLMLDDDGAEDAGDTSVPLPIPLIHHSDHAVDPLQVSSTFVSRSRRPCRISRFPSPGRRSRYRIAFSRA